jgi:hypothetical protein
MPKSFCLRARSSAFCFSALCIISLTLFACGGGAGNNSATLLSLGGTVSGLAGTGLVLQNNGANNSPVTANGPFALSNPVARNSSYDVTVLTQPSNPAQVCTVANSSGVATSNVTNLQIACTTTAYPIGGYVSGLTGTGLVLQDNGGNNLPISANGPFMFTNSIDLGNPYAVTVLTQPSNPKQTCTISNGNGIANAPVSNIQVDCSSIIGGTVSGLIGTGLVLQDNGSDNLPIAQNGSFTFLTQIPFGSNYLVTVLTQPSGPAQACIVLNGSGQVSADVTNIQVNCGSNWTWKGGPNTPNQSGTYGTMGVASPSNNPGARAASATWTDTTGNLWLYGGTGYDSAGTNNALGDLWKYSAGEWTWVSGSKVARSTPTWGTLGVADPANIPGSRQGAAATTDSAGNVWFFGGNGYYNYGAQGVASAEFNDLWEYSAGQWTWVSGSNTPFQGSYGTQGVASPTNAPQARASATIWFDAAGTLWLFGGDSGLGSGSSPLGQYNDVWMFSGGEWTWVTGSSTVNQPAVYGTLGTPDPGNTPGARFGSFHWVDSTGNFWIFGGTGYGSADTLGSFDDLWKYSAGAWTWMAGPQMQEGFGVYGTLGIPAAGNLPGARGGSASWIDASGNFWLFGESGQGSIGGFDQSLGDVWKYNGSQWTWMDGSNAVFQPAVYETLGMPGDPGGRDGAAHWIDKSGNLWIFGGSDQGTTAQPGYLLSDLWLYTPSAGPRTHATQKRAPVKSAVAGR